MAAPKVPLTIPHLSPRKSPFQRVKRRLTSAYRLWMIMSLKDPRTLPLPLLISLQVQQQLALMTASKPLFMMMAPQMVKHLLILPIQVWVMTRQQYLLPPPNLKPLKARLVMTPQSSPSLRTMLVTLTAPLRLPSIAVRATLMPLTLTASFIPIRLALRSPYRPHLRSKTSQTTAQPSRQKRAARALLSSPSTWLMIPSMKSQKIQYWISVIQAMPLSDRIVVPQAPSSMKTLQTEHRKKATNRPSALAMQASPKTATQCIKSPLMVRQRRRTSLMSLV